MENIHSQESSKLLCIQFNSFDDRLKFTGRLLDKFEEPSLSLVGDNLVVLPAENPLYVQTAVDLIGDFDAAVVNAVALEMSHREAEPQQVSYQASKALWTDFIEKLAYEQANRNPML